MFVTENYYGFSRSLKNLNNGSQMDFRVSVFYPIEFILG